MRSLQTPAIHGHAPSIRGLTSALPICHDNAAVSVSTSRRAHDASVSAKWRLSRNRIEWMQLSEVPNREPISFGSADDGVDCA